MSVTSLTALSGSLLNLPELILPNSKPSQLLETEEKFLLTALELHKEDKVDQLTDREILKFLRSNGSHSGKALSALADHLQWRKEFRVDEILEEDFTVLERSGVAQFVGRTRIGVPILIIDNSRHVCPKDHAQNRKDKLLIVLDRYKTTASQMDTTTFKALLTVFQKNYPETLQRFIIFPNSTMFWLAWKLLKGFIDPDTLKKIEIRDNPDTLIGFIDRDQLFEKYGGTVKDLYEDVEIGYLEAHSGDSRENRQQIDDLSKPALNDESPLSETNSNERLSPIDIEKLPPLPISNEKRSFLQTFLRKPAFLSSATTTPSASAATSPSSEISGDTAFAEGTKEDVETGAPPQTRKVAASPTLAVPAMVPLTVEDRASLPIKAYESQIVDLVRSNRVVLIAADTGAGKSTQVPQYLLAAGFSKIACTQPRRIACYSLARRVSFESLNIYGTEIAYQVRFEGTKTTSTKILFVTEGLLLRQYAADPKLSTYNVVIVDEVHERHVTGDFLLGVLKRILSERPDLKVVLMSATINATLFSSYFNAPFVEVPGRMFPVKIEYVPVEPEEDRNLVDQRLVQERLKSETVTSIQAKPGKLKTEPYLRILERIDQVVPAHERGDLLVFLSGMNEITTIADELHNYASFTRNLHSSLSVSEQEKVFDIAPPGIRKCILSTNIAETSVTIDGVRFIIDSGRVKETSFDASTRLSRLSEFWISKSSAKQRTGRAGRTGPGECFRFYTAREHDALNEFPVPEILRTPLEPLLLQTMAYGLGDPREFDFIEKPRMESIESAMAALATLGAIQNSDDGTTCEQLTPLGQILAILPMDVVLGKMLVLGASSDVVDAIVVMAAALSVPNPFVRVPPNRVDIEENRRSLQSDYGDSFTLMNLFSDWLKVKAEGRESSRNWCKRFGVEEQRLYEMVKLKTQFEQVLAQYLGREDQDYDSDDSESYNASNRKRKKSFNENDRKNIRENRNENEEERLAQRMFWKNPEFIKRKEKRILLEQQKRAQSGGLRKFLTFDDNNGEEPSEDTETAAEDISVNHLEFSLKHDASSLLVKSDTANLTKRDANLVRLVCCSGLYPHIAIADDANSYRPASEQVYHTKTKRFVKMLPTSVFAAKPELLHPKETVIAAEPRDGDESDKRRETLESIRPKRIINELICYLDLVETNKPYLTNVIRVPAAPVCLLFAHRLDVNHDLTHVIVDSWLHLQFQEARKSEQVIVLSNWLRTAWDFVISRRLRSVSRHGLMMSAEAESDQEPDIIGTKADKSLPASNTLRVERRVPSDWSRFTFMPESMKRIRYDWQMGTTQCGDVAIGADFEKLTEYELSRLLGEFLEIDIDCSVEKLRMQDVESWFGYDPFKNASSQGSSFSSALPESKVPDKTFAGEIRVTPHIHYFVSDAMKLNILGSKSREKLLLSLPEIAVFNQAESTIRPPAFDIHEHKKVVVEVVPEAGSQVFGCAPADIGNRKVMHCKTCDNEFMMTTVEFLRHKNGCKK
ncbi:DEAH (Asp-Glu-Ala-His) box polypeptide 34 [Entophlyctis luteolus]|nr:DEAH (Asp-Glu-Ala-His) box polypeptide 34 [Entophlyctis luteolus]